MDYRNVSTLDLQPGRLYTMPHIVMMYGEPIVDKRKAVGLTVGDFFEQEIVCLLEKRPYVYVTKYVWLHMLRLDEDSEWRRQGWAFVSESFCLIECR